MVWQPLYVSALVVSLGPLAALRAQQDAAQMTGPPQVLQIYREEVKPGKGVAHEESEANFARAFARAKWPTHYLGLTAMTGPNEAWFIVGYPSMAALEQDQRNIEKQPALMAELGRLGARDGEMLNNTHGLIATYIDSLSYKPQIDLGATRYFELFTFHVRPGHGREFAQAAKMFRDAYAKVPDVPAQWATFSLAYGARGPTFFVFIPAKSLEEMDEHPDRDKKFADAMGDENWKALSKIESDAYIDVQSDIFAIDPKMSYVAQAVAARDPDFWTPKPPAMAKKTAAAGRDTTMGAKQQ
jgi:hypothetical protein